MKKMNQRKRAEVRGIYTIQWKNIWPRFYFIFPLGQLGYTLICSFVNSFYKWYKFELKIRKTCYLVILLMVRYISLDFIYYMMISRPFPRIYGKNPWNCQLKFIRYISLTLLHRRTFTQIVYFDRIFISITFFWAYFFSSTGFDRISYIFFHMQILKKTFILLFE